MKLQDAIDRVATFKSAPLTRKPNYRYMPVTRLDPNSENADFINTLMEYLEETNQEFTRTEKNYVSHDQSKGNFGVGYDIKARRTSIELTVNTYFEGEQGNVYYCGRIQFRSALKSTNSEQDDISGSQAIRIFSRELEKDTGEKLDNFAVPNGMEYKKAIPKAWIALTDPNTTGKTFTGAHHIDFHNSYPAGVAKNEPQLAPTITRLYEARKENPIYKQVLNAMIGYCQSEYCGYRFAHLAYGAILDNNERIAELSKRLTKGGRKVLAYNTDGIWYVGEQYHGKGEGKALGEWENDHTDCQLRFKSAGSYEFIENGKYTPVQRGFTKLDEIKPRSEWVWGDIFCKSAKTVKQYTLEGNRIIMIEGDEQ